MSTPEFNPEWILESPKAPLRVAIHAFCPECGTSQGITSPKKRTAKVLVAKWQAMGLVVHTLTGKQRPKRYWHVEGCPREKPAGKAVAS